MSFPICFLVVLLSTEHRKLRESKVLLIFSVTPLLMCWYGVVLDWEIPKRKQDSSIILLQSFGARTENNCAEISFNRTKLLEMASAVTLVV